MQEGVIYRVFLSFHFIVFGQNGALWHRRTRSKIIISPVLELLVQIQHIICWPREKDNYCHLLKGSNEVNWCENGCSWRWGEGRRSEIRLGAIRPILYGLSAESVAEHSSTVFSFRRKHTVYTRTPRGGGSVAENTRTRYTHFTHGRMHRQKEKRGGSCKGTWGDDRGRDHTAFCKQISRVMFGYINDLYNHSSQFTV